MIRNITYQLQKTITICFGKNNLKTVIKLKKNKIKTNKMCFSLKIINKITSSIKNKII